MSALLQAWWNAVSGYFAAAVSVATGNFTTLPVVAALGLVCLVLGTALLFAWRVKRARRTLFLIAAAILAPFAISLANSVLGWLGMLFAVFAGAIILVVGTAVIGNDAERRLPVWLIGAFTIAFAFYCAVVGGAFNSLLV